MKDIIEIGKYKFKNVGIDGIYICDQAVFKAPFDNDGCNDWKKSSGKKLLEEWFKENAPKEIQEQCDIDLPMAEEVFSQKTFSLYNREKELTSKQFPLFKDSDERMKEFDGKPTLWWTRSALAGTLYLAWSVNLEGGGDHGVADYVCGFVPVLREKPKVAKKKIKDLTNEEMEKICNRNNCYLGCPLSVFFNAIPTCLRGCLEKEIEVPKE